MTDDQNRTGDEPMISLRRLQQQITELQTNPPPSMTAEQIALLSRLQQRINDLEDQIRRLVDDPDVVNFLIAKGYPRTGNVFPLSMPRYGRSHPEIVKQSWCRECGQPFEYAVYATGWTRTLCEGCKIEVRRRRQREYQQEKRKREREKGNEDGGA